MGEVYFHVIDTKGFDGKKQNERFTAAGSRCRKNLKFENFTASFGRLRQRNALKRMPHVQHDFLIQPLESLRNDYGNGQRATSTQKNDLIGWMGESIDMIGWMRQNTRAAHNSLTQSAK